MSERPIPTPPEERGLPNVEHGQHPIQHGEIIGLAELLTVKDKLPPLEKPQTGEIDEVLPMSSMLERKTTFTPSPEIPGCTLSLLRQRKKDMFFRLRVPLERIPLPRFTHVEAEWIELGLQHLEELFAMGGDHLDQLSSIVNAIKNFEETTGLIVRGDGFIFRPQETS
jgi:hypothetical protein